jgi:hypothetical protein
VRKFTLISDILNISTYRIAHYLDLNSGDIKVERYILKHLNRVDISETVFSKEVRRLGINIPDTRRWVFMDDKDYGLTISFYSHGDSISYGGIAGDLLGLTRVMDYYDISDSERIPIIEEVLLCIKKEKPVEAEKALKDFVMKLADSKSGKI